MARSPLMRTLMFFEYNIPITIFSKRGDGCITVKDKARAIKKQDGSFVYELKGRGEIKALSLSDLTANNQGFLYEKERGEYTPLHLDTKDMTLRAMNMDDIQFIAYNMRLSKDLYKNPKSLMALMQLMLPIMIIGIMIIGGLLIFDSVSKGVANVQGANAKIAEQQNQMLDTLNSLLVQTGAVNSTEPTEPIRW